MAAAWLLGCGTEVEGSTGSVAVATKSAMTFSKFKASVYREPQTGLYIVDGDTPIESEAELEDFYNRLEAPNALIVNLVSGVKDKWNESQKVNLTYCVSTAFGTNYNAVVQAMAVASQAWARVAMVRYVHLSAQDATCTASNANVVFDVNPTSGQPYLARSFFPSTGRASRNVLIDSSSFGSIAPYTVAGILRHELGHTLGFRHEHIRPEAGSSCAETSNWQVLTSYDSASVMHYPQCNGTNSGDLVLTQRDRLGAEILYGLDFADLDAEGRIDLNGDGRADVCGRGVAGLWCALSNGSGFSAPTLWTSNYSDAYGWSSGPEYYSTIRFADLNGDGRTDVCGRGAAGLWCGVSTGSSFTGPTLWSSNYSDAFGWSSGPEYYSTIRFVDLNGDGRADVCGRGSAGLWCGLSTGSSFTGPTLWSPNYSDAFGWSSGPEYYWTIRFADLNGDGRADVCGRGAAGLWCGLSSGAGFTGPTLWSSNYSDAYGWNSGPEYYSTIRFADLDGDGRADVCGRGSAGLWCGLSTGGAFTGPSLWVANYSNAFGWSSGPEYYSTIRFADLDGDGRADVCGRGSAGLWCGLSTGGAFTGPSLWVANYSDAFGWSSGPQYYSTIRLLDVNGDGRADVCGRGSAGLWCGPSTGSGFTGPALWVTNYSDATGWATDAAYFATVLR